MTIKFHGMKNGWQYKSRKRKLFEKVVQRFQKSMVKVLMIHETTAFTLRDFYSTWGGLIFRNEATCLICRLKILDCIEVTCKNIFFKSRRQDKKETINFWQVNKISDQK